MSQQTKSAETYKYTHDKMNDSKEQVVTKYSNSSKTVCGYSTLNSFFPRTVKTRFSVFLVLCFSFNNIS